MTAPATGPARFRPPPYDPDQHPEAASGAPDRRPGAAPGGPPDADEDQDESEARAGPSQPQEASAATPLATRSSRSRARDAGFEVYNLGGPSPRLPLEIQVARFPRDLEGLVRELARLHGGAPPVMHGRPPLHGRHRPARRAGPGTEHSARARGRDRDAVLGTRVAAVVCRRRLARLVLGAALRDLTWHSAAIRRLATSVGEDPALGVIFGRCGFQPLLPAAWINAWIGVKDTDGTIQPASAHGDGLWPRPEDVLTIPTGSWPRGPR